MELDKLEQEEVLTSERMDLIEFQKNLEKNLINKKLDEAYLEFVKNNDITIDQLVFLRKFCEYGKRGV